MTTADALVVYWPCPRCGVDNVTDAAELLCRHCGTDWTDRPTETYWSTDRPRPYDRDSLALVVLASLLSRAGAAAICEAVGEDGALDSGTGSAAGLARAAARNPWMSSIEKRWGVTGGELVSKLRDLPEALAFPLAGAIRRFWETAGLDTELSLRVAGLIRCSVGHSLVPPRDDCGACLMVRLGAQ